MKFFVWEEKALVYRIANMWGGQTILKTAETSTVLQTKLVEQLEKFE